MPGAEPRSRTAAARSWTGLAGAFLRELEPLWAAGLALGAAALVAAALLAGALHDPAVLVLGSVQAGLVLLVVRGRSAAAWPVLLGAVAGWAVALPLIWWWRSAGGWLTRNVFDVAVTGIGLYLVVAKLCRSELPTAPPPRWVRPAGSLAALAVLGYASLHTSTLFEPISAHHWRFYVGPAQLIRQGAVPLWDVPAQYGFLSELAIAWLPAGSTWTSAFALDATLDLTYAYALFLLLRAPVADLLDQVTSLLLAFVLVFGRIVSSS